MQNPLLLQSTNIRLYYQTGNFHIDPWQLIDRAVITRIHIDQTQQQIKIVLPETNA